MRYLHLNKKQTKDSTLGSDITQSTIPQYYKQHWDNRTRHLKPSENADAHLQPQGPRC